MSLVAEHTMSRGRSNRLPLGGLFSWFRRKVAELNSMHQHREDIKHLRCLDRHLLADMGVDIAELGKTRPTIAGFHPQVTAMSLLMEVRTIIPPDTASR